MAFGGNGNSLSSKEFSAIMSCMFLNSIALDYLNQYCINTHTAKTNRMIKSAKL